MASVSEFVLECKTFEYSKENYDLMKECAELDLMGRFIENQRYVKENVADMTALASGYFSESVESDQLQALTESFSEKAKALWDRIVKMTANAYKTFIRFMEKWLAKFSKINVENQKVFKDLNARELTEDQCTALEEGLKKWAEFVPEGLNQPFESKVPAKNGYVNIRKILAAGFSNTSAVVAAGDGAIAAEDLLKILKIFTSGRKKYNITVAQSALDASSKEAVEIVCNEKKIQKLIDQLKEFEKAIDEGVDEESAPDVDLVLVRSMFAELKKRIGATVAVYNKFLIMRKDVVNIVNGVLNKVAATQGEVPKVEGETVEPKVAPENK